MLYLDYIPHRDAHDTPMWGSIIDGDIVLPWEYSVTDVECSKP